VAQIIPFRGIRYNPDKISNISTVVTQPYDRIGEAEQAVYYDRNPYNIVRIVKGRSVVQDNGESVYTRAGNFLTDWLN